MLLLSWELGDLGSSLFSTTSCLSLHLSFPICKKKLDNKAEGIFQVYLWINDQVLGRGYMNRWSDRYEMLNKSKL